MTTATERAIAARETRSRNAAKKRGIGKYGDGYIDPEEMLADDDAHAEAPKPKVKKS